MIPLSVLDLSVVTTQTRPAAALRNSIDLARHVDQLGFVRYWLAEHHNLASVASPAPDVMIGQIAAVTKNLRVGSGGVMLPNHAPLVVAERFKMLEALFPGRIDLGLGRAPGTDGATAYALRSRLDRREGDDFLERLQELILWETRDFPAGHPYNNVVAMPDDSPLPPIWLLGSSDYSSELAAQVGMGFAFAHHFASYDAVAAMTNYRSRFRPSAWRAAPHGILAVAAVAAETDAEAEKLASSMDLNRLRLTDDRVNHHVEQFVLRRDMPVQRHRPRTQFAGDTAHVDGVGALGVGHRYRGAHDLVAGQRGCAARRVPLATLGVLAGVRPEALGPAVSGPVRHERRPEVLVLRLHRRHLRHRRLHWRHLRPCRRHLRLHWRHLRLHRRHLPARPGLVGAVRRRALAQCLKPTRHRGRFCA